MRSFGTHRLPGLHLFLVLLPLGLQGLAPSSVRADTPARNPAVAQALFDEAQRLMKAENYEAACPKFKESYDLDGGGGTLLNLADCYERQGRTALAWSTFKDALTLAQRDGRKERVKYARDHIASLEGRLAYLTIQVPEASRVSGLAISVDGSPIGVAAWGVALPVDPGRRVVRAEAPGKLPFEKVVEMPEATLVREALEIPPLQDEGSEEPAAAAPAETSGSADVQASTSDSGSGSTVGWVVGGVGVAALGVGGFFGLRAISQWNKRDSECVGGCNDAAKDAGDDAKTAANIATIGVGAGLLVIGVATYLILSSGGEEQPVSGAGPGYQVSLNSRAGGAELQLRSSW